MPRPIYGFTNQTSKVWKKGKFIEQGYLTEPPYGAFSLNRRTLSTAIFNIGKTASFNDQCSAQGDTARGTAGDTVEFTIEALSGLVRIGFAHPAATTTGDTTFSSPTAWVQSDGASFGVSGPSSTTPWVVGDKLALIGSAFFHNGVPELNLDTTGSGVLCFAISQAGTGTSRISAETKYAHMSSYSDTYAASLEAGGIEPSDWSDAPPETEPAATTYSLSPSTATRATGAASLPFTLKILGALTGTCVVTPTSSGVTMVPSTLSFTNTDRVKTFTANAAADGSHTIAVTNDAGLTNPASATLTTTGGGSSYPELPNFDDTIIPAGGSGVTHTYQFTVGPGSTYIDFEFSGGSTGTFPSPAVPGEFDIYIKRGSVPTSSSFDKHINSHDSDYSYEPTPVDGIYYVYFVSTGAFGNIDIYTEWDPG